MGLNMRTVVLLVQIRVCEMMKASSDGSSHRRTHEFTMEGFTCWGQGQKVWVTEVPQWGPGAKPR